MDANDYQNVEEGDISTEEEFKEIWQIIAVNEAVINNLTVRSKRDDEKVTNAQEKIDAIFKQAWYRNLGAMYPTVTEYINAATDLQVTYLSIIKEHEKSTTAYKKKIKQLEQNVQGNKELEVLNNQLSLQLKEQEGENVELKKDTETTKKENDKLLVKIAELGNQVEAEREDGEGDYEDD